MEHLGKIVLERNGFEDFNPVQKEAVKHILSGKNVVVSSPTASGKTLIAELAMVLAVKNCKKAVYTCPLRALAHEHYSEFSKKYPEIKTVLSTGDYDSPGRELEKYDVIFTTYEKLDSLTRHRARWLKDVGVLIVDEIHELDSSRGPTLEVMITKMLKFRPQIVALSATIPNAREIAEWLDAELVLSDWRPVKLVEGVFYNGVFYTAGDIAEIPKKGDDLATLVYNTLERRKQILIFTSTRKNAELLAKKISKITEKYVSKTKLSKYSKKILSALESPTSQCKILAECVERGAAFHHAGLVHEQRLIVEDLFRKGEIPVIVATPTLAAGVNLPAFRVVIHTVRRYSEGYSEEISVRDYKQMAGRAGRPKYDDHGEAIILAKKEDDVEYFLEHYVGGVPENVFSRLASEQALRFHTLALIASGVTRTEPELVAFITSTFYAKQYGDVGRVVERVGKILEMLEKMGFIITGEKLKPTLLGKRVSDLYIDPLTAYKFLEFAKNPKRGELAYLYTLSDSTEMRPYFSVSGKEERELWEEAYERSDELPVDIFSHEFDDYFFINKFKSALVFEKWINEEDEDEILKKYDISPGILRAKLSILEWLSYSMEEISKIAKSELWKYAHRMTERIRHGIKEELIPLVALKHIGRVRARKLWNAGFRSIKDIQKGDPVKLASVLGPRIAEKVLKEVGVRVGEEERKKMKSTVLKDQTTLDMFTG